MEILVKRVAYTRRPLSASLKFVQKDVGAVKAGANFRARGAIGENNRTVSSAVFSR